MSTDQASPKKTVMFSNRASLNIIFSISVLVLEVCCPVSPLPYAVFLRLHTLFWYLVAAFLMVDDSAATTESMSTSEKSEAAAVTEEVVHESDKPQNAVSETKYDEFPELYDQRYFDNLFVHNIVFKITYGYTLKRFVAPIVNGSFVFDMSDLKEKITYLFKLPPDSELELSYIDEHLELITMTDDNDLEDITKQMTLPVLKMYVNVINNAPPVQVGAGLKHTGTSKSTFYDQHRFLFKITYGDTVKRFVAPIVDGSFAFNMSGLKEKIKYLFNLPIDSELVLRYIDEHYEVITMTDDKDLEDIMTQLTLQNLRLYFHVINIAPPVQVGGGTGLKQTGTSEPTNTWESDPSANSDNDDWFLY